MQEGAWGGMAWGGPGLRWTGAEGKGGFWVQGAMRSVVRVLGGLLRPKASLFLRASLGSALSECRAAAVAWRLLCRAHGGRL